MVTTDLTYKAGGNRCTTSGQIATWEHTEPSPVFERRGKNEK
jgi:hypothetical protein